MSKNHNLPKNWKEMLLNESFHGLINTTELRKKYNASQATIGRALKQLGLTEASEAYIEITRRYLAGERVRDLCVEFNKSQPNVNRFFRTHNIEQRRSHYHYNSHFFDVIDSEAKAYFLGFIYADGCMQGNGCRLQLAIKDVDILEKLKSAIGGNMPIHVDSKTCPLSPNDHVRTYCRMHITHVNIGAGLRAHGLTENKSEAIRFPKNIPQHIIRHFIRGYVDGDGTLGKYGKFIRLAMCGNPEFLAAVRLEFRKISGTNGSFSKQRKNSRSSVVSLSYCGNNAVPKLLHYIYKDCSVYLDRKYQNYLRICK